MKKNKIIFWIASIIIALWEAVMPLSTWLFAPEFMTFGTRALSYPDYFAYSLVIAKVLGVIAITYPKTPAKLKEWAYAGLIFDLIAACYSVIMVEGFSAGILPMFVFIGIAFASYLYHHKKLKETQLSS